MQINSIGSVGAAQQIARTTSPKASAPSQPMASDLSVVDQIDFSAEAQNLLATQSSTEPSPDIRADRVATIRQAIADGTYETPERMSAALDKLLDTLA